MATQALTCDTLTLRLVSADAPHIRPGAVCVVVAPVVVTLRVVHTYIEHHYPEPSSYSPLDMFAYVPDFRGPPTGRLFVSDRPACETVRVCAPRLVQTSTLTASLRGVYGPQ